MEKTLNVGVIGLGLIGSLHARIMRQLPNASLVAVADADPERARAVGEEERCCSYTDYRDLLARGDIDAVSICVPDTYHLEVSAAAASSGKHILLEKPLAATVAEGEEIIDAVQAAGVRMMVAHILRFDPRYVQLHDALVRGELGEPIHLRLRRQNPVLTARRLGGSVPILQYLGIHDADLIRWYASSDVDRVYAQRVTKFSSGEGSGESRSQGGSQGGGQGSGQGSGEGSGQSRGQGGRQGAEDALIALLTFKSGAIGTIELGWALPQNFPSGIYASAEVVGTKGAGYVNILDQGLCIYTENGLRCPDTLHWPEVNGQIVGDLRDEIAHFVDRTLDGEEYAVSNTDALAAVRIIEACAKSIDRNQPVQL
ncbi:MAG: Gfo/Idh/MocA family oxidoreductase [Firmicutes bacterium]|nr:Gfo/Idh/MocA family oxidoreductase [Bacillota bacterium]MDH7494849.1 Gfo/Idh/MocA family oxidoreductase [Bacillota bacterium]